MTKTIIGVLTSTLKSPPSLPSLPSLISNEPKVLPVPLRSGSAGCGDDVASPRGAEGLRSPRHRG